MDVVSFDRVADIYDSTRSLPEDVTGAVLEAMRAELSECATVVDVGVGTGRFAGPLKDLGFQMTGVDVSRKMMSRARQKGVEDLTAADAHYLPFRDGTFDAAVVVHVMHLVHSWSMVSREIGRVTGKKVLSVIEREEGQGPRISVEYSRLRAGMGRPQARLEGAESSLQDKIHPESIVEAATYEEDESADEGISYLEGYGSSRTWGLEEQEHMAIIAELKSRYSGETWKRLHRVSVAVWDPRRFTAYSGA